MTYGVDQCRVCGKPIPFVGNKRAHKQEEANRRPMMAEKEWRRRGYLAAPTLTQIRAAPADGCCHECGLKEMNKAYKYGVRYIGMIAFAVLLGTFIFWMTTYMPH